jgi:hypothetical protein
MMNRTDFALIAETINAVVIGLRENLIATHPGDLDESYTNAQIDAIGLVVKDLAYELKDVNPRFNNVKFVKGCGF